MTHRFDTDTAGSKTRAPSEPRLPAVLGVLDHAMAMTNRVILALGGLCLVGACLVLTHSVVVRYVLREPTEWQDEMAVFLIIGATFLSTAGVQAERGHVAIEALTGLLPPAANRVRLLLADMVSLAFCFFFAWKSWSLDLEAWTEGQVSQSTWGPPLWIPYTLMSAGMSLLCLQFALQIAEGLAYGPRAAGWAKPKIGLGADINQTLAPDGPSPMVRTVTAKGEQ